MNEAVRTERTALGTQTKRSGRCRSSSSAGEERWDPATALGTPMETICRPPRGSKRLPSRGGGAGRVSYAGETSLPAKAAGEHGRASFVGKRSPSFQVRVKFPGKVTAGAGRGALRGNRSPSDTVRPRFARGERVPTNPLHRRRAPRGGADTCRLQHRSRRTNSANRLWCRRPACVTKTKEDRK